MEWMRNKMRKKIEQIENNKSIHQKRISEESEQIKAVEFYKEAEKKSIKNSIRLKEQADLLVL